MAGGALRPFRRQASPQRDRAGLWELSYMVAVAGTPQY